MEAAALHGSDGDGVDYGLLLLALCLLLHEYRSISIPYFKKNFRYILLSYISMAFLYIIYGLQDPAQIYQYYSLEFFVDLAGKLYGGNHVFHLLGGSDSLLCIFCHIGFRQSFALYTDYLSSG